MVMVLICWPSACAQTLCYQAHHVVPACPFVDGRGLIIRRIRQKKDDGRSKDEEENNVDRSMQRHGPGDWT